MSINSVVISGNLVRDPELRQSASGSSLLTFSIAVNDRVRNQQTGEWEDRANFFDVVMFGNRADSMSRIMTKGMKVTVAGRLRQSSWDDRTTGKRRSKVEVIADNVDLPQRRQQTDSGQYQQQTNNYTQQQQSAPNFAPQASPQYGYQQDVVFASDIPF